ncbi:MAG: SLBB domain-containing protein [Bacteroidota bacterium]|nr:SLBB domain-containing protein [Bacteroidota bacterium]
MRFYYLLPVLLMFLLLSEQKAFGQSTVNPATVNVNSLSDSQIQRIMQEIQSRGLTREQAIALAKAKGVTQTQIDQLMNRLQQQQMNPTNNFSGNNADVLPPDITNQTFNSPKARVFVSEKTQKIFGYQLFNSRDLSFEPSVNIPIPPNYTLGIGDQLSINVWGASQSKYQFTIDMSGSIIIPNVGPIYLAGLSFEKGQSLIKSRLMAVYSGMAGTYPNTWAEVSLEGVRSIKINVIGEINAPGTYTLPATASAFNAFYLSGGPNENGSFREIKLIRDGVIVKTIDVYDFLINADPAANVQLREQDILFVPNYTTRVEIDGEIKRKGIFEIKKGETISDLIRFAGGFGDKAYTHTLSVLRNNDREREVRAVVEADFVRFPLQNGDFVKVDSILNRFSNRVAIAGAVFHPGNFELTPGMKLSDLIKKADGLREDAFMNRGLISRIKEDNSPENISFDLNQVLSGSTDMALRKEDKVLIRSIFEMREERKVNIIGEVMEPKKVEYEENMTLGDLIFKAGGFREEADLSVVEVTRRLSYDQAAKVNDKMNEIFQFSLTRDLKLSPADAAFKLQPFDDVYVRRAPGYRDQGTFTITGEVIYAGTYSISNKNEKISDAIKRAGGLIPGAFTSGATLSRTYKRSSAEIEKRKQLQKMDSTLIDTFYTNKKSFPVGIELNKILATPGSSIDLLLQSDDVIHIPRELQTVNVSGSVMNPLALTYEKKHSLRQYINMAGGYNSMARKSKTYVIYPNGNTATTTGFIFRKNPVISPGAEIIVPEKPEKKNTDNTMKWISIASGMSSLTIGVVTLMNLLK